MAYSRRAIMSGISHHIRGFFRPDTSQIRTDSPNGGLDAFASDM